jgi:hypothetical protein
LSFKKDKSKLDEKKEQNDKKNGNDKKNKELFEELGVLDDGTAGTISIQRVGGTKHGYIDRVGIDDVRQLYGTLPEYLKTQHGPGEYVVTVSGAKGEPFTQRIRIAGETDENNQSHQPPQGSESPDSTTMAMVLQLQIENAKLQAEREASQGVEKTQLWGQIAQYALPFIETLFASMKGNQQQDVVSVIKSATESIKELSEIKQTLTGPAAQSNSEGEMGTIISAIAQALQGISTKATSPAPLLMPSAVAPPVAPPTNATPFTQPSPMPQPPPQANYQEPSPAQPSVAPTKAPPETTSVADLPSTRQEEELSTMPPFVETVIGMMSQQQTPEAIAEYLVTNLASLTQDDLAQMHPQVGQVVSQLIGNPLLAWDTIVQLEPSLHPPQGDAKYNGDIRAAIQNIVTVQPQGSTQQGAPVVPTV